MKIAVWDTYFRKPDGVTLHFDILVPEDVSDFATVCAYGRQYLANRGFPDAVLDACQCQFCHIEWPTEKILATISRQGYAIVEMEDIPPVLPAEPTRRDYILYLRANYPEYRFADFRGKSFEAIKEIAESLRKS
ncbi:MAG: DUF2024 family protein [Saprospiraceae bacterium]|nr:DUF2024 family protein [Saprospiraceae bacterium]MDW8485361.1 DUF2024 family protein [Saprospiraceae bacterium]